MTPKLITRYSGLARQDFGRTTSHAPPDVVCQLLSSEPGIVAHDQPRELTTRRAALHGEAGQLRGPSMLGHIGGDRLLHVVRPTWILRFARALG